LCSSEALLTLTASARAVDQLKGSLELLLRRARRPQPLEFFAQQIAYISGLSSQLNLPLKLRLEGPPMASLLYGPNRQKGDKGCRDEEDDATLREEPLRPGQC